MKNFLVLQEVNFTADRFFLFFNRRLSFFFLISRESETLVEENVLCI